MMVPMAFQVLRNKSGFIPWILILAVIAISFWQTIANQWWYWESSKYLAFYLGLATPLAKIFDFRGNDALPAGQYRIRDLGNVLNWLDAQLLVLGLKAGIPALVSYTYYAALLAIAVIQMYFSRLNFGRPARWVAAASTLLFLTAPAPFLTGSYGRTNKIIVALLFILVFWMAVGFIRRVKSSTLTPVWLFLLLLAAALTDETGLVFLFALAVIAGLSSMNQGSRRIFRIVLSAGLAIFAVFIYRYALSPAIVYRITSIRPHLWDVKTANIMQPELLIGGLRMFLTYVGMQFGNTGIWGGLAALTGGLVLVIAAQSGHGPVTGIVRRLFWPLIYVFVAGLCIMSLILMSATLPGILSPMSALMTYPIPFNALFACGACLIGCAATATKPAARKLLVLTLLVMSGFNVLSLPSHTSQVNKLPWERKDAREIIIPVLAPGPFNLNTYPFTHYEAADAVISIRARMGKK
ncbi:hypothetical protein A2Z33_03965 [Candidatus Gottesmanbacteria bacterium RBG_16_52_11]|uniref:Glycosyltransferase RgtA/B/C/D-like domain-containing protein n=1 Tax=Candidatus Gottesmanbacteria bacterium RBG_16_52_11 TaxID=1798374 RepID=A0A1F5YVQ3_9BACT|nr:MAG: hypothetical protein A2Z33_03965 [Candidatus Gottesmanbacteria bacterium RBG_16_52_11]